MEKIGFLYMNTDNEMVCNEYFRIEDNAVKGYVQFDDETCPLETEFLSFEELAQYYDGRSQAILVFNEMDPAKAEASFGLTMKEFSMSKGYGDDEQKLADDLEKSGVFNTEYPEEED